MSSKEHGLTVQRILSQWPHLLEAGSSPLRNSTALTLGLMRMGWGQYGSREESISGWKPAPQLDMMRACRHPQHLLHNGAGDKSGSDASPTHPTAGPLRGVLGL